MTEAARTGSSSSRSPDGSATIVVVGLPRGGGSMVAGVLRQFGVHMSPSAEARKFAAVLGDNGHLGTVRALIERNDATHDVWGLELSASRLLPSLLHLFRNPRVIGVFRDPVACAAEGEPHLSPKSRRAIVKAAAGTFALAEIMRETQEPTLAISYEVGVASPAGLAAALLDHCGLSASEGQWLRAIRFIKSGGVTRPSLETLWYEGRLSSVDDGVARGWARRMPANEPCMVEIVSNGAVLGRGLSNKLSRNRTPGAEDRGFEIELGARPGVHLFARVAGTATSLATKSAATRSSR